MNYIEREAAIRAIENDCLEAVCYTKRDAIDCILSQPLADVVENKEGQVLLPLTKEELHFLVNDAIAYIWSMEKSGRNKEEFGYFSRKELLKKLEYFLKSFEKPVCCCDKGEKTMDKKKFESLLVPPRIKFSEDESDLSKIAHVDLVMVVRCKDCGYYDEKKQICKYRPTEPLTSREPDWYCAGGVRREK